MVESRAMQDVDAGEDLAADGRMVTSVAWVSRGYAKAILEMADPEEDEKNIMMHSRMQKKLAA